MTSEISNSSRVNPRVEASGRYEAQMTDFAEMIRGKNKNLYSTDHELVVHKALLQASGLMI